MKYLLTLLLFVPACNIARDVRDARRAAERTQEQLIKIVEVPSTFLGMSPENWAKINGALVVLGTWMKRKSIKKVAKKSIDKVKQGVSKVDHMIRGEDDEGE